MAWPVVTVASGGIPVTDNSAAGWGTPIDEAANGRGTAVTYTASGGLAVLGGAMPNPPVGFTFLQLSNTQYELDAAGDYIAVRVV